MKVHKITKTDVRLRNSIICHHFLPPAHNSILSDTQYRASNYTFKVSTALYLSPLLAWLPVWLKMNANSRNVKPISLLFSLKTFFLNFILFFFSLFHPQRSNCLLYIFVQPWEKLHFRYHENALIFK